MFLNVFVSTEFIAIDLTNNLDSSKEFPDGVIDQFWVKANHTAFSQAGTHPSFALANHQAHVNLLKMATQVPETKESRRQYLLTKVTPLIDKASTTIGLTSLFLATTVATLGSIIFLALIMKWNKRPPRTAHDLNKRQKLYSRVLR